MKKNTELPYLCLRALVLFPEVDVDLAVGRAESKLAVQTACQAYAGKILVVTQRRAEQTDNLTLQDLYSIGTLCRAEASVTLEELLRLRVQGLERVRIEKLYDRDGVQTADFSTIASHRCTKKEWQALRREILEHFSRGSQPHSPILNEQLLNMQSEKSIDRFIYTALRIHRNLIKESMRLPTESFQPFPEDEKSRILVNRIIAAEQTLLEEATPIRRLQNLKDLLAA